MFTACSHNRDMLIRNNLPGSWHMDMSGGGRSTHIFAPNGDFKCNVLLSSGNEIDMRGRYQILDGFLVEMVTNVSPAIVMRFQIIRANDKELVVLKDGMRSTIEKDTK